MLLTQFPIDSITLWGKRFKAISFISILEYIELNTRLCGGPITHLPMKMLLLWYLAHDMIVRSKCTSSSKLDDDLDSTELPTIARWFLFRVYKLSHGQQFKENIWSHFALYSGASRNSSYLVLTQLKWVIRLTCICSVKVRKCTRKKKKTTK